MDRAIKFSVLRATMDDYWKPGRGFYCKELDVNLFLFQFFHELDYKRVTEGGPWTFDNSLLVLGSVTEGEDPRQVQLAKVEFWVQLFGIKSEKRSEMVCEAVGKYLGDYVKSDPRNFEKEKGKEFMRIGAAIDVTKPLKKDMRMKKAGGDWLWIDLKYEKLPSFCFCCGIIGHGKRSCELVYERPELVENKPYGAWLRAVKKGVQSVAESKWLRNSKGEKLGGGGSEGVGGSRSMGLSTVAGGHQSVGGGGALAKDKEGLTSINAGVIQISNLGDNRGLMAGGVANFQDLNKEVMEVDQDNDRERFEEDLGVVISDAKRKGVDDLNLKLVGIEKQREEEQALTTKSDWALTLNGPAVGPGSQAYRGQ